MLSGTDGALYSGNAAYNLELCPTGFHVPDNSEWDSFVNAGGSVLYQVENNYVQTCGSGGGTWDWNYYWSSAGNGHLLEFTASGFTGFNQCCFPEYGMLIKCVAD